MNKSRAEKVGIKKGTFKKSRTEKCSSEKGRTNMSLTEIIRQTDELTFLSFQIKNIRYSDLSEISDRLYFYI